MKNKKLDQQVKQYIIDCIDNSGYGGEYLGGDHLKIKFLRDTFYSEYGWAVERMGEQNALKEWFSGLPSSCNIAFMNYEIIQIGIKWGSLAADSTEKQQDKVIDNWFNLLAAKTCQLFRKHSGDSAP